jgi:hypothetical protein
MCGRLSGGRNQCPDVIARSMNPEAIQTATAEGFWIAWLSLAMTAMR